MMVFAQITRRWQTFFALACLSAYPVAAQRINFGAYATSQGITLTLSGNLNFNDKQPAIITKSNAIVTIALTDMNVPYVKIVGDATRDITVTVSAPTSLTLDATNQIPFTCQFAYSNHGLSSDIDAKVVAVQVPGGFTSITFPMVRRTSAVPAPPPTPAHGTYTPPSATAYLFLYGQLGPVGNVAGGLYTGTINVSVQY